MSEHSPTIGKMITLLRRIHIHPLHILLPVGCAFLAAVFEGAGMGLLIPILSGFLQKSFSFLREAPVMGRLLHLLPTSVLTNDRQLFGVLLGGFILIYILRNVLRFLSVVSMAYFAERAIHHHRKALFSTYLTFGKLFFDTTNVGHHALVLQEFSRHALYPIASLDKFINSLFALGVYLVVMLMISWKLTLVVLPLFAVLHVVIRTMIFYIKGRSYAIVDRASELNKKSVEILSTIPLVKSYRTEGLERKRYTAISDAKARLDFQLNALLASILPLQEIITVLVAAIVFFGVFFLFGRNDIASEPALLVYFYIIVNATSKFGTLSGYFGSIASVTGPLDAVLAVFNEEGKFCVRDGTENFVGITQGITCRDLTFSYGDRDILKHVSFTMQKGQMTAIVGPTGAGKSTLIHLLMRYYDCPPASIFIDGTDIRSFTLDSYLKHVAIVSQETLLLHDSLRNNILYGLSEVREEVLQDTVQRARLKDFVALLPQGLDTLIGDRGVKLSGGEKQRVAIARALLKGADILILDEATSSLDSQTEKMVQEALDEAIAGRTAISIAHRLSTIRHADHIVVLKDGQVAEEGTLETLLQRKGVFFQLWAEQRF